MESTVSEVKKLTQRIKEYEDRWYNDTDPEVQNEALDRVGAVTIDDAVLGIGFSQDQDEAWLELVAYSWKDLISVVAHYEHEIGLV